MSPGIINIIFAIFIILSTKRQNGIFPDNMSSGIVNIILAIFTTLSTKRQIGFIIKQIWDSSSLPKEKKTLNLLGDFCSTAPPQITPPQIIRAPPLPPPPPAVPHNPPPPAVTHENLLLF
nr:hypothetical protein [Tanacetum cinerariifolium]